MLLAARSFVICIVASLSVSGCGWGYFSLTLGGCPGYDEPGIVVRFYDSDTGQELAVEASGVSIHAGRATELGVYEAATPYPFVFSLYADTRHQGAYRVEVLAARQPGALAREYVFDPVYVSFDACGPITRYLTVRVD